MQNPRNILGYYLPLMWRLQLQLGAQSKCVHSKCNQHLSGQFIKGWVWCKIQGIPQILVNYFILMWLLQLQLGAQSAFVLFKCNQHLSEQFIKIYLWCGRQCQFWNENFIFIALTVKLLLLLLIGLCKIEIYFAILNFFSRCPPLSLSHYINNSFSLKRFHHKAQTN